MFSTEYIETERVRKQQRYGKLLEQFRRGLISQDEMMSKADKLEAAFRELNEAFQAFSVCDSAWMSLKN